MALWIRGDVAMWLCFKISKLRFPKVYFSSFTVLRLQLHFWIPAVSIFEISNFQESVIPQFRNSQMSHFTNSKICVSICCFFNELVCFSDSLKKLWYLQINNQGSQRLQKSENHEHRYYRDFNPSNSDLIGVPRSRRMPPPTSTWKYLSTYLAWK